jgi:pyruvate dehydrogenase E2 component (dihydrolipoamide acetyltransferase)
MPQQMKFQDPGEGIHEGEVVDVLVSQGDTVEEGDDVLVVETDKATTDLPATHSGTIAEIKVSQGDRVEVGDVLLVFGEDEPPEQQTDTDRDEQQGDGERSGGKAFAVGELPEYEAPQSEDRRQTAQRSKDKRDQDEPGRGDEQPDEQRSRPAEGRPVPASPATRRLARELNVDLRDVEPSGPHGRVTDKDVRAAAEGAKTGEDKKPADKQRQREPDTPQPAAERRPAELPDFSRYGPVERVPLRGIRRATAKRMTVSWQQIPKVVHHDSADITELERWRRERAPAVGENEQRISLMVLVMKAVAGLLQRHPRFNSSLDAENEQLILKHHCHLGIAVDTDQGLVVGVVRDVDRTPLVQLAEKTEQMIQRVRSREVEPDELRGATFTITNVGPLGGTSFEPLVNFPEAAILGMARAKMQQVVSGDFDDPTTDFRYLLPLSLSYDHRINDGADAARFVSELCETLRDVDSLLMNV